MLLWSRSSSRETLETDPLLNLICSLLPLPPALWAEPDITTVLFEPPLVCFGLLDVGKPSAQELTDEDEEEEEEREVEEGEDDRCRG